MTPGANDLCVFAVKRGDLLDRFDVTYALPKYTHLLKRIDQSAFFCDALKEHILVFESGFNYEQRDIESSQTIRLLRTQNVKPFFINDHNVSFVSNTIVKSLTEENDLLFVRVGAGVGDCAFISKDQQGMAFSDNVLRVHFDNDIYGPFIAAFLSTDVGKALLMRQIKGSGKPVISRESIEKQVVPLPSVEQQEQLFKIIEQAHCSYKTKLHQADELLAEMSKFIHRELKMKEVSGEKPIYYGTIEKSTVGERIDPEYHSPFYTRRIAEICKQPFDTLGNIVEFSAEAWNQKDYYDLTFPYIEISNVYLKENKYDISYINTSDAPSRAKMIVRNGDIIVSTTRPHRGAIATIQCKEDEIQIASTGFCVLRELKRKDVLKEYLQWILLDDYILLQMLQRSSGGNYPAIVSDELKKIVIPIPRIDIQRTICEKAERKQKQARELRREAEQEWAEAKARFERELLGE